MQDYYREDELFDISIIKFTDGSIEFYTENAGKIWEVTDDVNLIYHNPSKNNQANLKKMLDTNEILDASTTIALLHYFMYEKQ